MGQSNQNFYIVDGEKARLAMKHPLIPVLVNLISECDDIALFKTQFPFIFRFKVIQSSAAGLIHLDTWRFGCACVGETPVGLSTVSSGKL